MDSEPSPKRRADLADIAEAFDLPGAIESVASWGSGHIHDTYRLTTVDSGGPHHTLVQRINHEVFPDPRLLMASMRRVTAHLRAKVLARGLPDPERRVLTLLETRAGEVCYHRSEDGTWWRAFPFLGGTRSYDQAPSPAVVRKAAFAFGSFQRDLADLPPPRLPEILPHFHDTASRLGALKAAVEADAHGRVAEALPEIEFALAKEPMTRVLVDAHAAGAVPERVTHNDTKINNVLFDDASNEAICVIDLDTVMPGLGLHDFGDMVRTCASPTAEDERDLDRIHADPTFFRALVAGYIEAMGDLLTLAERDLLPFSGRLITYELGLRVLTDFLQGDTYFHTVRPDQNLDRARAQFALLRSLESQDAAFRAAIPES